MLGATPPLPLAWCLVILTFISILTNVSRKLSLEMIVLWDVAPCNLVEIDRHFRDAYCLHHQGDPHTRRRENLNLTQVRPVFLTRRHRNAIQPIIYAYQV
jgi:hypothetical protein